jgi:hypothetical protein
MYVSGNVVAGFWNSLLPVSMTTVGHEPVRASPLISMCHADRRIMSLVSYVRNIGPGSEIVGRPSSTCTSKLQTRPLVREGAQQEENCRCLTVIKIWSWAQGGCPVSRRTGRLTVGRKTTSTSIIPVLRRVRIPPL